MKKTVMMLACALFATTLWAQAPVLTVEGGQIEGVVDAEGVAVYKGIPYAAPPVGDLRWKQPQPVQPWQGVRKCDKFGELNKRKKLLLQEQPILKKYFPELNLFPEKKEMRITRFI